MSVFIFTGVVAASINCVCRYVLYRSLHLKEEEEVDGDQAYLKGEKLEEAGNYTGAVKCYEKAIQLNNNSEALYKLATLYKEGSKNEELSKDLKKAEKLSKKSIELTQDVRAMHNLGVLYMKGDAPIEKDINKAYELFEKALQLAPSNSDVMVSLAILFETGSKTIPKDNIKAKQLYERAILEDSNETALYNLAIMLRHGTQNIPQDIDRSITLYQRAIDEYDDPLAMFNLASLLWYSDGKIKDQQRAIKLLSRGAENKDDIPCCVLLGKLLETGSDDGKIKKDLKRSCKLYDRAIEKSSSTKAMYLRAILAREGKPDGKVNNKLAVELLNRAIKEGDHAESMELLGEMTILGEAEKSRELRAKELFEKASNHGSSNSMYYLARILETGAQGVAKDVNKAKELYEKVANEHNHSGSMNRLGIIYRDGLISKPNPVEASNWFKKAVADDANAEAMCNYADMLLEGAEGVQKGTATAVALLEYAYTKKDFLPAKSKMAMLLWTGDEGVKQDTEKALKLAQEAVDAENKQFDTMLLSWMYMSSKSGLKQDRERALSLLDEAFRRRAQEPIVIT